MPDAGQHLPSTDAWASPDRLIGCSIARKAPYVHILTIHVLGNVILTQSFASAADAKAEAERLRRLLVA